jgi:hypothetical protein
MSEINLMRDELIISLKESYHVDEHIIAIMEESFLWTPEVKNKAMLFKMIAHGQLDRNMLQRIKFELRKINLTTSVFNQVITLCKREIALTRRIEMLSTLQNLFKNWHVIHLPFALIMLAIMIVHVVIAVLFGYRWIF